MNEAPAPAGASPSPFRGCHAAVMKERDDRVEPGERVRGTNAVFQNDPVRCRQVAARALERHAHAVCGELVAVDAQVWFATVPKPLVLTRSRTVPLRSY